MESTVDATSATKTATKKAKGSATTKEPKYSATSRIPILGTVVAQGQAIALDPPSDDQILKALEKIPGGKEFAKLIQGDQNLRIRIVKEKIADYLDLPKFVPLIGEAQLHHAHYECMVYVESASSSSQQRKIDPRTIYVDHQHYQLH